MALIICDTCKRELSVGFGGGLSHGWPECCGYTMRLQPADREEIHQGMVQAMRPLTAMKKALK